MLSERVYKDIISIVEGTQRLLLDDRELEVRAKGRADFVTQVDVAVQEYLRRALKKIAPEVILIAEEQERVYIEEGKAYWILDPIDGTQNFIRHVGLSAVSLAYYAEGALQFGVIFNPFTKETFSAIRGKGAFLNGQPMQVTDTATLADSLMAIGTSPYDRQLIPQNWALFQKIHSCCLDVRRSGSAALDLAYVAAGRYDGYFERNLKPWDMAAGILLVQEAGGHVTDYTGKAIDVNYNSDICAANGKINKELLAVIGK
jgi:myo-inositol-1(or 4)-monophosphatase